MTKEEAEKIIVEDLLIEAVFQIEFLDACLKDKAIYGYPEQTQEYLNQVKKIITMPMLCYHSFPVKDCLACAAADNYRKRLNEAKEILARITQ